MRSLLLAGLIVIGLAWSDRAFACTGCAWHFVYQGDGQGGWCLTCDYDLDCGTEICNIVQVSGWDACETNGNGCFTTHRHCALEPQVRLSRPVRTRAAKLAPARAKKPAPRRTVS